MSDTPTLSTRDEWLVLIGYEAGREDGKAVGAILTDLIAELRDTTAGYEPHCDRPWPRCGDADGESCRGHREVAIDQAADRAEARLKEVQGE